MLKKIAHTSLSNHFWLGLLMRLSTIAYGLIHDRYCSVQFTDADYAVFTSGAKAVLNGKSPYEGEPEYRYSPLLAYLLIPNAVVHPIFGKLLFSMADVWITIVIYNIVQHLQGQEKKSLQCAILWTYNVFSAVIAARGNSDSLTALLVLYTLYCHQLGKYRVSAVLLGLAAHFRLYPIIFLPALFVTVGEQKSATTDNKLRRIWSPFREKFEFAWIFAIALLALTWPFYHLYGEPFVRQAILYHLNRVDIRHNFSVYFYFLYLNSNSSWTNSLESRLLLLAPQAIIILVYCLKYHRLRHLSFSMFCTTFTFVIFNKVLTSQYTVWYLSLLPTFLPIISLSRKKVSALISLWIAGQAVWLAFAYALEFEGYNTFVYIWSSAIFVLAVHVYILKTFIERFDDEVFVVFKKRR